MQFEALNLLLTVLKYIKKLYIMKKIASENGIKIVNDILQYIDYILILKNFNLLTTEFSTLTNCFAFLIFF